MNQFNCIQSLEITSGFMCAAKLMFPYINFDYFHTSELVILWNYLQIWLGVVPETSENKYA
jgi:hypothetical protein